MHDFIVSTEIRVFVLDGIEAVRTTGQDLANPVFIELGDVRAREFLKQTFLSKPAGGIAGTALGGAEHREPDTGTPEQLCYRPGDALPMFVERARATDPIQHVDSGCVVDHFNGGGKREVCGPGEALFGRHTERIAALTQRF